MCVVALAEPLYVKWDYVDLESKSYDNHHIPLAADWLTTLSCEINVCTYEIGSQSFITIRESMAEPLLPCNCIATFSGILIWTFTSGSKYPILSIGRATSLKMSSLAVICFPCFTKWDWSIVFVHHYHFSPSRFCLPIHTQCCNLWWQHCWLWWSHLLLKHYSKNQRWKVRIR